MTQVSQTHDSMDVSERLLNRWVENDAHYIPCELSDGGDCSRWSDQARICFSADITTKCNQDELLAIFDETWNKFRLTPRGTTTSIALLHNLRVGGQTGQVWVEDLMALVRYNGNRQDEALDLLCEVVAFATNFTAVRPYTKEKVQLLSSVLSEMTNALLVESSEPRQTKRLSISDPCRFNAAEPNIVKRSVFDLLDENYVAENAPEATATEGEEPHDILDWGFVAETRAGQKISEMCSKLYRACWRVLQGRTEEPNAFEPESIKDLILYFELSYFWAHRAISSGIDDEMIGKDYWATFFKVQKAARPEFGELVDSYLTNQPTGLFPQIYHAWRDKIQLELQCSDSEELSNELFSDEGILDSTEPQSWNTNWEEAS